ncbi:hypothetical protein AC1031_003896 [Aphanomyces cochlioides]|nr:hypothetical protein AC1031_003896 [Aphanomyces cochlioides]
MYRFIAVAAGAATIASAGSQPSSGYSSKSGGRYGSNSGRYSKPQVTFEPAYQIIDPSYSTNIFTRYQTCLTTKCSALPTAYSSASYEDSLGTIAAYTSCVTSCAAAEALETVHDFQTLLGQVLEIGSSQLTSVRKHLSGQDSSFDPIAERVHIGESCCLPTDYFVEWSRILIPVEVDRLKKHEDPISEPSSYSYGSKGYKSDDGYGGYDDDESALLEEVVPGDFSPTYMISAQEYLAYCTDKQNNPVEVKPKETWVGNVVCDDGTFTQYLHFLQANIGHLILAPDCDYKAPDHACCESKASNPRAATFSVDVCVATEAEKNGKTETLSVPLVKPVDPTVSYKKACPPDDLDNNYVIYYERVAQRDLKFFTVTTGLPSGPSDSGLSFLEDNLGPVQGDCTYDHGLAAIDGKGFFESKAVTANDVEALKKCPEDGLFEYCNLEQYAGWLQRQLFDHSGCDIADLSAASSDIAPSYQTISCLYKIFTLKCDCMEAVLNCYTHASKFDSALSKTIGQAASILCGFILCQQPKVYALFGEEYAIDHAILIKEFLQSSGLMTPSDIAPALTMLVSFGLGMVALVAVKKVTAQKEVKIENGYQNLI